MFKAPSRFNKHSQQSDFRVAIALDAGLAFILQVVGVGLSYFSQILLARWLGATAYGQYIYTITWASLLSVFASLGFPTAVLRFVPEYITQKNWSLLRGILHASSGLVFLLGLVISIAGTIIVRIYARPLGIGESLANILALGIWLVPIFALVNLNSALFKAFRKIVFAYVPQLILRPIMLVASAALLLLIRSSALTAKDTLAAMFLATITALFIQIWALVKILPSNARNTHPAYDVRRWIRVALPLLLISGYLVLLNQMDVIMVGYLLGPKYVGIYNAAAKTAALVGFVLMAVNAVLAPMISSLYAQGNPAKLQQVLNYAAHGIFWPSLLIAGVLVFFGKPILKFFGPDFVNAYSAMVILVIGQLINAGAGSVGYLMNLTGHQNQSARVYGWSVLANIVLNVIGISFMGVTGAAIATASTMALWNVWLHKLVAKNLGVYPSIIFALFGKRVFVR